MGIPLDVFSLLRLRREGADCEHHLLVRVGRPEFGNADEADYARAVAAADERRDALLGEYESRVLAGECAGAHRAELVGELQARPVGEELSGGRGGFYVGLWVAETRYGSPWVVMGAAADEKAFWREVEEDADLSALGARGPARPVRAYFLAEPGGGAD